MGRQAVIAQLEGRQRVARHLWLLPEVSVPDVRPDAAVSFETEHPTEGDGDQGHTMALLDNLLPDPLQLLGLLHEAQTASSRTRRRDLRGGPRRHEDFTPRGGAAGQQ